VTLSTDLRCSALSAEIAAQFPGLPVVVAQRLERLAETLAECAARADALEGATVPAHWRRQRRRLRLNSATRKQ
jgi:hypothetical protein